jgi:hypothetical protein
VGIKKVLANILLLLLLGAPAAALAAPDGYRDLPPGHWAYKAVEQLVRDGVLEPPEGGYFQGGRAASRYEMAVVTARALEKIHEADSAQRVVISELGLEFVDELKNIELRLQEAEERENDWLSFSGNLQLRYRIKKFPHARDSSQSVAQYRLRLNAKATVDDKTSFNLRIVNNPINSSTTRGLYSYNSGWQEFGDNDGARFGFDRYFVSTKLGVLDLDVGRQALYSDPESMVIDSGALSFTGLRVGGKLGILDLSAQYGRLGSNMRLNNRVGSANDLGDIDIASLSLSSKIGEKFFYSLGYFNMWQSDENMPAQYNMNGEAGKQTMLGVYHLHGEYRFNNKLALSVLWGKNTAANKLERINDASAVNPNPTVSGGRFYSVEATIGDRVLSRKGRRNFVIQYNNVGNNALIGPLSSQDTPGSSAIGGSATGSMYLDGWKNLSIQYNYAFTSRLRGQLTWSRLSDRRDQNNRGIAGNVYDYNYWKFIISAYF